MSSSTKEIRKIVVSGAGPAGILCTALLLARNEEEDATIIYDVTLVDGRQDFGALSKEELSKSFRSWMLGLANHGMDSIREIPDLYNNYVKGEGVELEELNLYLGSKKITQGVSDDIDTSGIDAFIVDRNFIVAALARYVRDSHTSNKYYTAMYDTTCQYVDYENKQVLVRNVQTKKEEYIPYDLLIGCDGVRSVVREALIKRHSDFTCKVSDIFQEFKAVHVDRPKELSAKGMSLLPNIFKNCQGIALPETGGKVNISIGVPRNLYEELDEELKSNDYKVVSKYFKENFKAFELVDYDDYAKQWVGQRWNQTGMVHCNKYHSSQMNIVIMGDAAHATSPSIGMGMNTALRDARVFYQLLKENKDDIEKTLPLFSEARVKEGNSLSSLAFNLYCLDSKMQTMEVLHMIIRTFLHKKFPKLVTNHPQNIIGMRDVALSDVYDLATRLNIIPKLRARNELIQHQHFEKLTGMTKPERKKYTGAIISVFVAISAVVVALKVKE